VLHPCLPFEKIAVQAPAEWVAVPESPYRLGFYSIGTRTIRPREQFEEIVYIHPQYAAIPHGKASLKFTWAVGGPEVQDGRISTIPIIAAPSATIDIRVPSAASENILAMRERLAEELADPQLTPGKSRHLASCIVGTRHREFIPIALHILDRGQPDIPAYGIISSIYQASKSAEEAHALLVQYVNEPVTKAGTEVFDYWQFIEKRKLPGATIDRLLSSPRTWVRVRTCFSFAKDIDDKSKAVLLQQLRGTPPIVLIDRFSGLIRQLNSDTFADRENAVAELERLGEHAETALRKVLDEPQVSLETRRHVQGIVDKCEREFSKTASTQTMQILENARSPEAQEILDALAHGHPKSWWTIKAKAALEQRIKSAITQP